MGITRFVKPGGNKNFTASRFENGGWKDGLDGLEKILYRLDEVKTAVEEGRVVFVVEGEKDADRLVEEGFVATTNPFGAGNWQGSFSDALRGAHTAIIPDNDDSGHKHARQVANSLSGRAASVKLVELPLTEQKADVSDYLDGIYTPDDLQDLVTRTPAYEPSHEDEPATEVEPPQQDLTQAQRLIQIAQDAMLFHTPDDEPFASFPVGQHYEHHPIRSTGFRRWLLRQFYELEEKPPGAQAMQDALGVLEARAIFDGNEVTVYLRVAHLGERIYLDLANDEWQAVEIDADGWRVVNDPPVKFRRAKGMNALPTPETGDIEQLRRFINLDDDEQWVLTVAWLVASLSNGPYPILALHGEQGSAKSTTSRLLRSLIDPSVSPIRSRPREERDLMISANNSWVLAFDNLSYVANWLSDAFCRLSTGGGLALRTLYENDEELFLDAQRPVLLNGIEELATRGDLADRALILNLPPIPDSKRMTEEELWDEFEEVRPGIIGGLLDCVSAALRHHHSTHLSEHPRMADFARWVVAAEEALPWSEGRFMDAYGENRAHSTQLALESDQVATAIRDLYAERGEWEGTATDLLAELEGLVSENVQRTKSWPKAPNSLARRLNRSASALREVGIDLDRSGTDSRGRSLIRIVAQISSIPSVPSGAPKDSQERVDDIVSEPSAISSVPSKPSGEPSVPEPPTEPESDDTDDTNDKLQAHSKDDNEKEVGVL